MRARAVPLALVVAAALLVAACTRAATALDQTATQTAIGQVVAGRTGLAIRSVQCPRPIPRGSGRVISCQVRFDAASGTLGVSVRQVDEQGGLSVAFRQAVTDPTTVGTALTRTLVGRYGRAFTVTCGTPGSVVVPVGHVFTCRARDATSTRVVAATVTDPSGTLHFRVGAATR